VREQHGEAVRQGIVAGNHHDARMPRLGRGVDHQTMRISIGKIEVDDDHVDVTARERVPRRRGVPCEAHGHVPPREALSKREHGAGIAAHDEHRSPARAETPDRRRHLVRLERAPRDLDTPEHGRMPAAAAREVPDRRLRAAFRTDRRDHLGRMRDREVHVERRIDPGKAPRGREIGQLHEDVPAGHGGAVENDRLVDHLHPAAHGIRRDRRDGLDVDQHRSTVGGDVRRDEMSEEIHEGGKATHDAVGEPRCGSDDGEEPRRAPICAERQQQHARPRLPAGAQGTVQRRSTAHQEGIAGAERRDQIPRDLGNRADLREPVPNVLVQVARRHHEAHAGRIVRQQGAVRHPRRIEHDAQEASGGLPRAFAPFRGRSGRPCQLFDRSGYHGAHRPDGRRHLFVGGFGPGLEACPNRRPVRPQAAMKRPVWLLSLDTDQFCAPPLTTGALQAYFERHGVTAPDTEIHLLHFATADAVLEWLRTEWATRQRAEAAAAVAAGLTPVLGLSCYTWNVAEFLEVADVAKRDVPGLLIVAGGPHVQKAEDFLGSESIDVVVLGEGEITFTHLLDCQSSDAWSEIAGLAYPEPDGSVRRTPDRPRVTALDVFPSALDVVPLRDADGRALYERAAYETSRGCPYRCSFCEWGTGAIGTKMYQFGLERIRGDLDRLVAGGISDIWFCDSNFGALREDVEKAEILIDLKRRTGKPHTFATSWSKNHNQRVQGIVRRLHGAGLLWHYHLALQTLTPLALELSHRTNMRANDYEPVVKALAAEGVPVTAELIWGLPGDTLAEFAGHLDRLFAIFPNINIFAYTLLPGTEFYEKRDEYRLVTLPVAGYGKAKGEYVVGCHTFPRSEGEEGYVLVAAHVMLSRGHVLPYTLRLLALDGRASVSSLLRDAVRALIAAYGPLVPTETRTDRMAIYAERAALYVAFLRDPSLLFETLGNCIEAHLRERGADDLVERARQTLAIDAVLCPRVGASTTLTPTFGFAADRVLESLGRMDMPEPALFDAGEPVTLDIRHDGAVGEVLKDPDGGAWFRGRVRAATRGDVRVDRPLPDLAEQAAPA